MSEIERSQHAHVRIGRTGVWGRLTTPKINRAIQLDRPVRFIADSLTGALHRTPHCTQWVQVCVRY
jgi:hypothetical protein